MYSYTNADGKVTPPSAVSTNLYQFGFPSDSNPKVEQIYYNVGDDKILRVQNFSILNRHLRSYYQVPELPKLCETDSPVCTERLTLTLLMTMTVPSYFK